MTTHTTASREHRFFNVIERLAAAYPDAYEQLEIQSLKQRRKHKKPKRTKIVLVHAFMSTKYGRVRVTTPITTDVCTDEAFPLTEWLHTSIQAMLEDQLKGVEEISSVFRKTIEELRQEMVLNSLNW